MEIRQEQTFGEKPFNFSVVCKVSPVAPIGSSIGDTREPTGQPLGQGTGWIAAKRGSDGKLIRAHAIDIAAKVLLFHAYCRDCQVCAISSTRNRERIGDQTACGRGIEKVSEIAA
ncbi:MAG: hypothetical protein AAFR28_17430 [Pseudomonadota bacterium]